MIPSMRKTKAPKTPAAAPGASSDPAAEQGVLGWKPSQSPSPDPVQGREPRPAAPPAGAGGTRGEIDTELQAFLDMRDQTDSNTEVRDRHTDTQTDRHTD